MKYLLIGSLTAAILASCSCTQAGIRYAGSAGTPNTPITPRTAADYIAEYKKVNRLLVECRAEYKTKCGVLVMPDDLIYKLLLAYREYLDREEEINKEREQDFNPLPPKQRL